MKSTIFRKEKDDMRTRKLWPSVTVISSIILCCSLPAAANTGDLRTSQVVFANGYTNVKVPWNPAFPDLNYTAVCTAEQTPSDFLLPVITSRSAGSMTVVPTDYRLGGVLDCIAIPDSDNSDIRHSRASFSGFPLYVTVPWNPAFTDTNYTAVCTVETQDYGNGEFTSVINNRSTDSISVTNGSSFYGGTMHCLAIPDSDVSDVRRGRIAVSASPATVTVPWNQPFTNKSYVAVCSDEVPGAIEDPDSAIAIYANSKTPEFIVTIPEIASGYVHCIGIKGTCATARGCGP